VKKVPIEKLVEDMDFYPRNEVSSVVVTSLVDALEAGSTLPPIVADSKFRLVDGWHRLRAHKKFGATMVMVDIREFASDAEMFKVAVELNSGHGRRLDTYDLKRSVLRMQELGLAMKDMAEAVRMTPARLEDLIKGRATQGNDQVILKAGLAHLQGTKLTKNQRIGVEKASGMQSLYHVNQLLNLLENEIAPHDENFVEGMDRLAAMWKLHRKFLMV